MSPLEDIVFRLNNDAVANQFVEYIHSEGRDQRISADEYIGKYFDKGVRKSLFEGTVNKAGVVNLSAKATLLREAFQRRFANSQEFPPQIAYHGTKDLAIADLILTGGFEQAREKLFGPGVYFYVPTSAYRAESIALQAGKQAEDEADIKYGKAGFDTKARIHERDKNKNALDTALSKHQRLVTSVTHSSKHEGVKAIAGMRSSVMLADLFRKYRWEKGCVLKVTIFSNTGFNNGVEPQYKDRLIERKDDVLVVKNPLVIFPTAVFTPGDQHGAESDGLAADMGNLGRLQWKPHSTWDM